MCFIITLATEVHTINLFSYMLLYISNQSRKQARSTTISSSRQSVKEIFMGDMQQSTRMCAPLIAPLSLNQCHHSVDNPLEMFLCYKSKI